jgi:hypothetical protein
MVERSHRQLKAALRARLAATTWPDHLPWVLLGLRSAPKEDSGISSAELVFGAPVALPGQFVQTAEPPAAFFAEQLQGTVMPPTRPLSYAQVAACPPARLMEADFVYVRRGGTVAPLSQLYVGPYRVLDRQPKYFSLQVGGNVEVVTIDRLKPHLGCAEVQPALPPLRGRPRAS